MLTQPSPFGPVIEGVHAAPFGARLARCFQGPVGTLLPFGKRALRLEPRAIRFG